jgi:hypothetical protein
VVKGEIGKYVYKLEVGTMDFGNTLAWRRYSGSITNYIQSMISQYVTALFVHFVKLSTQYFCIYNYSFKVSWLRIVVYIFIVL